MQRIPQVRIPNPLQISFLLFVIVSLHPDVQGNLIYKNNLRQLYIVPWYTAFDIICSIDKITFVSSCLTTSSTRSGKRKQHPLFISNKQTNKNSSEISRFQFGHIVHTYNSYCELENPSHSSTKYRFDSTTQVTKREPIATSNDATHQQYMKTFQ